MSIHENLLTVERKLKSDVKDVLRMYVAPAVKEEIAQAVETEVYEKYTPTQYSRRGATHGGLQDPDVMDVEVADAGEDIVLAVQDLSRDDEDTNIYVADIVESGKGYTWEASKIYRMQPFPRPFHKVAQEQFIKSGQFEKTLKEGIRAKGYKIK